MSPLTDPRVDPLSRLRDVAAKLRGKTSKPTHMDGNSVVGADGAQLDAVNAMATVVERHNEAKDDMGVRTIARIRKIEENVCELEARLEREEQAEAEGKEWWTREMQREDYLGGLSPRRKGPRSEVVTYPKTTPEEGITTKDTTQTESPTGDEVIEFDVPALGVDEFGVWTQGIATAEIPATQITADEYKERRASSLATARPEAPVPGAAAGLLDAIEEEDEEDGDETDDGEDDDSESTEFTFEEGTVESFIQMPKSRAEYVV